MGKIFLRGLLAITPAALTVAVLIWVFMALESSFSIPIKAVIGENHYFPGMGIVAALIVTFLVGSVINSFLMQKIYHLNDRMIRKIPLIKTVYNSISDVVEFFSSGHKQKMGHVVMLRINGWRLMGFVTREDFSDLPPGIGKDDEVAVYVPFSYQIGGYTFMIPRSELEEVEISVEEAMRFSVTAGMLKDHKRLETELEKKKSSS